MGYVALALALIAGLRPSAIVLVTILYGALYNGAKNMGIVTGVPLALMTFVIAMALMFVAAPQLIRSIWRIGPSSKRPALTPVAPPGPVPGA
jgi:simple sugar transport system permease protein